MLIAVLVSGCAALNKAPTGDSATKDAAQATVAAAPTDKSSPDVSKPAAGVAAPKAKIPATPAVQPAKVPPTALAKTTSSPPLNLKSLESRLKETNAIGVFTKVALKNQVDDLLDQFRAHYQGERKTSLAELRRPYEMLLQKVLALLQDTDPPLAGEILASREAIWGILADPAKFAAI